MLLPPKHIFPFDYPAPLTARTTVVKLEGDLWVSGYFFRLLRGLGDVHRDHLFLQ